MNFNLDSDSVPELIQGMMFATVLGLEALGRSGSNAEIEDKVAELEGLTEEEQQLPTTNGKDTKFHYYMAWARTHLKKAGIIKSAGRAIWAFSLDIQLPKTKKECIALYQSNELARRKPSSETSCEIEDNAIIYSQDDPDNAWRDELLNTLKSIHPDAFERLAQRILRESGFIRVKVLGKTNDGGIDGVGVLRISLLSFHVYFQCKRYKGSVGSKEIRDFRGAIEGRGDQGLFITTGTFTSEAQKEATRDGARTIELIDGDALCDLLEKLQLGVETKELITKQVSIDAGFYEDL